MVFSNTVATGAPVLYKSESCPQLLGVVPVAIKYVPGLLLGAPTFVKSPLIKPF